MNSYVQSYYASQTIVEGCVQTDQDPRQLGEYVSAGQRHFARV